MVTATGAAIATTICQAAGGATWPVARPGSDLFGLEPEHRPDAGAGDLIPFRCLVDPARRQGVAGSNPVSPTNHLGEIAKEIPAASLAAARHWGFWTLVGPNFVRARTNSQTVLPLAASEGARQVLALGAKVRPGPGPSASSSRSAISPRRLSASAALADALSRPADQWTAGPGDREFFRSTRV